MCGYNGKHRCLLGLSQIDKLSAAVPFLQLSVQHIKLYLPYFSGCCPKTPYDFKLTNYIHCNSRLEYPDSKSCDQDTLSCDHNALSSHLKRLSCSILAGISNLAIFHVIMKPFFFLVSHAYILSHVEVVWLAKLKYNPVMWAWH